MNIFNRIVPWFIPTKDDQKKWYTEEISQIPKEQAELLSEFQKLSEDYNRSLGNFEAKLAYTELYEEYLKIRSLAQNVNFLWNRIGYKRERYEELKNYLKRE